MCLSNVFILKSDSQKELFLKNIASVEAVGKTLRFTNVLGIPTEYNGEITDVNLVDNYICVKPANN